MKRGEIYLVNLDPVVGREQSSRRPVLVVSLEEINRLPLVVTVVPGTDGKNVGKDFRWNVRVPSADSGLRLETVFLCFQIRALDKSRFTTAPIGNLPANWMEEIEAAMSCSLDIPK